MSTADFDLARFTRAQQPLYEMARAELAAGRKRSHWMWFMFPQLAGLGCSDYARLYGLGGLAEARAYLADPVLGPRLLELTRTVLSHGDKSVSDILGSPDDLKFCASMTLFQQAAPGEPLFARAIDTFCGAPDPNTLALLEDRGQI